jgi:hypothetical protein
MKRLMAIFSLLTITTGTVPVYSFFKPYTVKQYAQVVIPLSFYSNTTFNRYQSYIRPSFNSLLSRFTIARPQFSFSASFDKFLSSFSYTAPSLSTDAYVQEDKKMCELVTQLLNPQDSKRFPEIKAELEQLTTIKEKHPELMDLLLNKEPGFNLFLQLRKMSYTQMPPQFGKTKQEILDQKGLFELVSLGKSLYDKFF